MMNTETMRSHGFIRIDLHIDYLSALDNEQVTDEVQSFWVQPLAPDRFKIQESSGFLHEYKLFFGDEIVVEPMDTSRYKLKSVIDPSPMRHFFFIGSGQPTGLTQGLHELGGQWECEMGGLTIFHVPRHQLDAFQARFGMDLNAGQEMFSGVQDWSDEIDALS
jgi:hypothetical protein